MKKVTRALGAIIVAGALLGPPVLAQTGPTASADIVGTQGQTVGTAHFTQDSAGGVRVHVVVQGLTGLEGQHGIHIHAVGTCEPDKQFSTAGPHFNPTGAQHGLRNPQGPHVGDLPNLSVDASGAGILEYTNNLISLSPGPNNIFDEDGAAIVIHAGMDDEVSDPAGNSGARVACGVIGLLSTEGPGMPRTGASEAALPWLLALIASVMTGLGALAKSRSRERAAVRLRIERDHWR
ncbi:MAG: superoxide dismutase family protein [Chloroflexota bacterium]|nr:superoxide dismutase family protein [Chloroflexota bacterium]